MNLAPLAGKKTYIAALLAILGAVLGGLDGDLTWPQSFELIVPAVLGLTLRHGISSSALSLAAALAASVAKAAADPDKQTSVAPELRSGPTTTAALLLAICLGATSLAACSAAQLQQAGEDAQQAQQTVATAQVIGSDVACTAQAGINLAGAAFAAAGDAGDAATLSLASKVTGSLCTGLAVGTPLVPAN